MSATDPGTSDPALGTGDQRKARGDAAIDSRKRVRDGYFSDRKLRSRYVMLLALRRRVRRLCLAPTRSNGHA